MIGKFHTARLLAIAAVPALVAACSSTIATRGNLLEEDRIAAVQPGATKNDVIAAWGSPTTVGTFANDVVMLGGAVLEGVRQIGTGVSFSCALLENSSVLCWGWSDGGRFGDGSSVLRTRAYADPALPVLGIL